MEKEIKRREYIAIKWRTAQISHKIILKIR